MPYKLSGYTGGKRYAVARRRVGGPKTPLDYLELKHHSSGSASTALGSMANPSFIISPLNSMPVGTTTQARIGTKVFMKSLMCRVILYATSGAGVTKTPNGIARYHLVYDTGARWKLGRLLWIST